MNNEQPKSLGNFRFLMRIFRSWKRLRDAFAKALDVDVPRKIELYTQLSTSATLKDLVYWLQIIASAGIATLGLVLNSTAVIIGAMLISPLMAPILSQGLALATGDLILGVRSIVNLALSTLLGILVAIILVALLPFNDITAEISARTKPNTLDLGIALFSGAIGAVATCREVKGVVTSIPGVAIAVALMPPLCVVGYGIGYGLSVNGSEGWKMASGGGLLYLTNLVAITFTAMLVFVFLRIDRQKVRDVVRKWRDVDSESQWWMGQLNKIPALQHAREVRSFSLRLLMILLPLLIIIIPLSNSLSQLRTDFVRKQSENRIKLAAKTIWEDKFQGITVGKDRSEVGNLRINETEGKLYINMRVFTDKPYTTDEETYYIALLAKNLEREKSDIILNLTNYRPSEREPSKLGVKPTQTPITLAQRQAEYMQNISNGLRDFKLPPPATLVDYSVTAKSNNQASLHIYYLSERKIEPDGEIALQENVRSRLNLKNLSLNLMRISSEVGKLVFVKDGSKIDEKEIESLESLEKVGNALQTYSSLKLRVTLKTKKDDKESFEIRQNAVKEFFMQKYEVSAERLIFNETDDEDLEDSYQLFY